MEAVSEISLFPILYDIIKFNPILICQTIVSSELMVIFYYILSQYLGCLFGNTVDLEHKNNIFSYLNEQASANLSTCQR